MKATIVITLFLVLSSCNTFTWQRYPDEDVFNASPARGKKLYNFYCAGCHGPTGLGDGPDDPAFVMEAPDIIPFAQTHTNQEIAQRILSGSFNGMPEHQTQMSDQDVKDVIRYLQFLSD